MLLQSLNADIDDNANENVDGENNGDTEDSGENSNNTESNQSQVTKQSKLKKTAKESYQISKNLDLSGKDGKQSFSDFYHEKKPESSIEFNVVAIYYLNKIMGLEDVTIEDVYTCYRNVDKRAPKAFKQSLADTSSSKYGYIEIKNGKYSVPISGMNFVEHDLPKNKNDKKDK